MPANDAGNSGAAVRPAVDGLMEATGREIRTGRRFHINIALTVLTVIALIAALYFARAFLFPC